MAWAWYPVKTLSDTLKNDVPDEAIQVDFGLGAIETIRFIHGFSVGIIFRNFLLFPNMSGRNPFTQNNQVGAMIHDDQYWVGINLGDE